MSRLFYEWGVPLVSKLRKYNPIGDYRAEICIGNEVVARMPGKHNTKEQLEAWLKENWPGTDKWEEEDFYRPSMTLIVWRYTWAGVQPYMSARTAVPYNMLKEVEAMLK